MSYAPIPYLPFSQREGLAPIPPQLKLGEVSKELRNLIYYAFCNEIYRVTRSGMLTGFPEPWRRVASDFVVHCEKENPDEFENKVYLFRDLLKSRIDRLPFYALFDLVEFFVRHPGCRGELKDEVARSFVEARAAYRIIDNQYIVAIGTEEQAAAFERAIADAELKNATGARKHLIEAGVALRKGDWAGSVRESIHAVESVACELAPGTKTLGDALKVIEKNGHLHGRLKAAFDKLYAYSSDENGVRHALVFGDAEPKVDETDALFMLGACASFVSYLLARHTSPTPP